MVIVKCTPCTVGSTHPDACILDIVPLEPKLVMSTPTYDPFGTETTYKSKLFLCQMQGSRKCGSTGAALLGNGRQNWGNDANGEKRKREENKERKQANGKWGKKMKGKRIGRGKEKERRRGQDILKNYRVTMKIVNRKFVIVNLKKNVRKMWFVDKNNIIEREI